MTLNRELGNSESRDSKVAAKVALNSEDAMKGWEKRGGWKTSRMTPLPKRGFGPPRTVRFSTPLRWQCSVFPVTKIHDSRPEALLEESAFSGTFSSPHTFCTPPYHGPRLNFARSLAVEILAIPALSAPRSQRYVCKRECEF